MRDFGSNYKKIYGLVSEDIAKVNNRVIKEFSEDKVLSDKLREYLKAPSKHIRAVLSFLYLRSLGLEIDEKQILFQSVIEMIHNASLIHDDVIDESQIRRGNLSLNSSAGNHIAVILGDYVISKALNLVCELDNTRIYELFSKTMSEMCIGEVMQYNSLYKIPTIEEYLDKTYKKTATLFEMALCGALYISGSDCHRSVSFAKNFGIAFQLRDDIKNIVENIADSDIKNGVYTAPVIFSGSVETYSSGIEKAVGLSDNYIHNAKKELDNIGQSEYKTALIELTELLRYE